MTHVLPAGRAFSFVERPFPIPGDLRVNWRVSLILLMLLSSRGQKASWAKLHMLNDALRSSDAARKLELILNHQLPALSWRMRVEPAFGRAIDIVVGEKFAERTIASGRSGLALSQSGIDAAKAIMDDDEILKDERDALERIGKRVTEKFVAHVISVRGDE